VTLVARPVYLGDLLARPLHVYGIGQFQVRVKVAGQLAEGNPDYLVLAVKTPDTASALAAVAGLQPQSVLSLQNGILKDEQLAAAFGRERVIGATTILGATMTHPGVAEHTFNGATLLGELQGGGSERVERLVAALSWAGLHAEVAEDIVGAEWSKLCQIVPAALLSVLTRLPYYRVCATEPLAARFVQITRECAAVAEACGARVGDYPGFNVRTLVELPEDEAVACIVERGRDLERRGMVSMRISMLQDLERGRRLEVEETVGEVVRRGGAHGVPLPTTAFAYSLVKGIEGALSADGGPS
jgi:2-dehydropantoate 2-reductase